MRLLLIAILLASAHVQAADAALGRLFSTPSERANLDHLRQTRKEIVSQPVTATPTAAIQPLALPESVEVQGYVKRSDGKKGTVWVNRQAVQEGTKSDQVTVGHIPAQQNRVPIQINASGKVLSLKAGQTYNPETNRVREMRSAVQGESGSIGDENTP